MRVRDATPERVPAGTRVRATYIAPSEEERAGGFSDVDRLTGKTGTVEGLRNPGSEFMQLDVEWDEDGCSLCLVVEDHFEILGEK